MEIYTFCRIPHRRWAIASLLLIVAILTAGKLGQCQDIYDDYEDDDGRGNTVDVPIIAITVYDSLMSLTRTFTKEFGNQLKFYIKDSYYCRKGSISEIRCFKKSSCKQNSSNQDITIFGALVMVALCLLILIIYNFSGQILSNRERRQAKSREDAARIAREIAQIRERWILARDVAKENHEKLLRTLSRKPSNSSGKSHGSSDATSSKNVGLPPMEKESGNLTKVIQSPFGAVATV